MKNREMFQVLALMMLALFIFSFAAASFAQQLAVPAKARPDEVKEKTEKVVASPANIKQGTALYVFVVWMWAAILILIYVLRLKIKESDRLLEIKYSSLEKK